MTKIKNIGIIGCGKRDELTQIIPGYLTDEYTVKAIHCLDHTAASGMQRLHPGATLVDNHNAIFEDDGIDHVIILRPSSGQKSLISQALGTGKTVQVV